MANTSDVNNENGRTNANNSNEQRDVNNEIRQTNDNNINDQKDNVNEHVNNASAQTDINNTSGHISTCVEIKVCTYFRQDIN